jgi:cell division septation protein DedD
VSDERAYDEQLPWLQAVDDEDQPRGFSARRMLAALLLVLLAAAIVAATFFWLGRRDAAPDGAPELIQAPTTPYKVKPSDPGGLDVAGESETAFETSAGEDRDSRLDLSAMPEAPVAKPAPEAAAPATEEKPAAPAPKPAPAGGAGSTVQLGAFQNQAQAERAWSALSARFPAVAAMSKLVVPFSGGIRLRATAASPADAKAVCQTLKAAGENCFVAQ